MWFFPIAIAAGNTVVLKPSEKVPTAALWMAELWKEAGLPDGVFNVFNGDKVAVDALLTHPDVQSISFVGSTPIARYVYETGTAHGKRVQALGGAKNHMLVLPDADLDLAADQAINAGLRLGGGAVHGDLRRAGGRRRSPTSWWPRSRSATVGLRTGDGTRGCDMGPLVTAAHRERVSGYVDAGEAAGATWSSTAAASARRRRRGLLRRPDAVRPRRHRHVHLHRRDLRAGAVGGPRGHLRGALELINANPYGNGTAIFTNDGGAARRFQNEVRSG